MGDKVTIIASGPVGGGMDWFIPKTPSRWQRFKAFVSRWVLRVVYVIIVALAYLAGDKL